MLYGGAVGGGKTDALIAAASRWAPHPKHRSLILRRERDDLQEIIDRARELYGSVCPQVKWVETRSRFEFPTGSFIRIESAQHEKDIESFKSDEYNFVAFDELTTFTKYMYVYMLSRNRSKTHELPLHIRAGTNPDGVGHEFVFKRFIENREPYQVYRYRSQIQTPSGAMQTLETTRQFIPSTVFDNPDLPDRDQYIAGLQSMGRQLSEALLLGRWDYFRGQMFPYGKQAGLVQVEPGIKSPDHYVVRCMDYGWNDPTVIYWLIVYPRLEPGRVVVEVADELWVTETSIPSIVHLAKKREERLLSRGMQPVNISVADPSIKKTETTSHRSVLDLFIQHELWFTRAINDRQAGWAQLRLLLEAGNIRYWKGAAPHLVDTLPKLVRDPGKADDIRSRQNDHPADTLRYGVMAIYEHGELQIAPAAPERRDGRDPVYDKLVAELRKGRGNATFPGLGSGW